MFRTGQRWMSEAEPDLGLGVVVEAHGRTVRVRFPASGEERIYARESAPLSRVCFVEGDRIEDADGHFLEVRSVINEGGLRVYRCEDGQGNEVVLPEPLLNDRMRLNRPQDKLLGCRLDPDVWFGLRYRTWLQHAENWRSPVFGLVGPRIDLIPHQLYIAHEVASRQAPRVLLADEVGLGKTIEAGLILHRLLLSGRVQRVLIVVPEVLLHQWLVEMLRRFNLHFSIFDEERFAASGEENPFLGEQQVLCSLEFLTGASAVARAALAGEWDLLVVDEAHHLAWSPEGASLEYELVEALAGNTPAVLLLTATPEQLGRAGHFARLRLLDPQRFHDYGRFLEEECHYEPVARLVGRLMGGEGLTEADGALLRQMLGEVDLEDHEAIIRRLLDRHGTGRVLFRNTRQAVQGFPERMAHGYPLPMPADYRKAAADPTPETHYPRKWRRIDPRVGWLIGKLRELAPEKALVICAHAQTVTGLRDWLFEKEGLHVAVFHEGMEIVERDRAAVYFADTEEGAQALICSEIGSEGRNFQFAHHLILFDLPLEPELLEQRIGRLDRIGQQQTIRLHVPYIEGTASQTLWRWYQEGLNALVAPCPAAGAVYAELGAELCDRLAQPETIDDLIERARERTSSLNRALEEGRDRLLELHSHRPELSQELVRQIRGQDQAAGLVDYVHAFWDAWGIHHSPGRGASEVVRPGGHMRHEHFPGLARTGATVTWSRADALTHEDRAFMTWEHPMVRGAMELLISTELGSAAITVCAHPGYRTGTLFLELLYLIECMAPSALEAERYLPPTCLRILLDGRGQDLSGQLPHERLQGQDLSVNRPLAETILKSQGRRIRALFQVGEERAEQRRPKIVEEALARMHGELDRELERLTALRQVNPNVREDELEQLQARRELLEIHLTDTRVRLDAVRVIVMR